MWNQSGRWTVTMTTLPDGRVQLLHTATDARPPADAKESIVHTEMMTELSRANMLWRTGGHVLRAVTFRPQSGAEPVTLKGGPARFGPSQGDMSPTPVTGRLIEADPPRVCPDLVEPERYRGRIVLMDRGGGTFVDKARKIQAAGATGGIVVDHTTDVNGGPQRRFTMKGDGKNDVTIPMVLLLSTDGERLRTAMRQSPELEVTLDRRHPHFGATPPPPVTGPDILRAAVVSEEAGTVQKDKDILRAAVVSEEAVTVQKDTDILRTGGVSEEADIVQKGTDILRTGGVSEEADIVQKGEQAAGATETDSRTKRRVSRGMWSQSGRWTVTMTTLPDGQVQLLHTPAKFQPPVDAEKMKSVTEMRVLYSRAMMTRRTKYRLLRAVTFCSEPGAEPVTLAAGPAEFGLSLGDVSPVTGPLVEADPVRVCPDLVEPERYRGRIVLMERGGGTFVEKARKIQAAGAIGGIVANHPTAPGTLLFPMAGDGHRTHDVTIPMVLLLKDDGEGLRDALRLSPELEVTLSRRGLHLRDVPPPPVTGERPANRPWISEYICFSN